MNDTTTIPKLVPIFNEGKIFYWEDCKQMEGDYIGVPGERVCIHFKRPQNRMIVIKEMKKPSKVGVVEINRSSNESDVAAAVIATTTSPTRRQITHEPFCVAGTTKYNRIKIYTAAYRNMFFRLKPYSGIGYREQLCINPLAEKKKNCQVYTSQKYSFNCMDLKDVFTSEVPEHIKPHIEVRCVVQQKKCNGQSEKSSFRFGSGGSNSKFEGLNPLLPEEEICRLIRTQLPTELQINILRYMNYDQVKGFADSDERFARDLANTRYKINSHDMKKFPNMSVLLPVIQKEAAKEMRFSQTEDLWIASVGECTVLNSGIARRFLVKPGTYKWHMSSAITNVRYNSNRAYCDMCTRNLVALQKAMAENQEQTVEGKSWVKVFSLEGSESEDIDTRYTSPYYRSSNVSGYYDYAVHLWLEDLDNRWLQDLQSAKKNLELNEYKTFDNYKTLIFKDPVKFLGTNKSVDMIEDGILALTSKLNGEVVGYLVDSEEFRLRIPLHDKSCVTGLNFIPPALHNQTVATIVLVQHIRSHEIEREIADANKHLLKLQFTLAHRAVGEDHRTAIEESINHTLQHINHLHQVHNEPHILKKKDVIKETTDNKEIHVHEIYEEGFDFCTKYLFYKLGASGSLETVKRNTKSMFTKCSYEQQHPDKICTLKVFNPFGIRSLFTVRTGQTLEPDLM